MTSAVVRIEPFTADLLPQTAAMLARAFAGHSLRSVAFGAGRSPRHEVFLQRQLAAMPGPKHVARNGDRVVGFIHWSPSTEPGIAPRLHLDPIAVDPPVQGRHIGQQLMRQYCLDLDERGLAGYLETDRAEHVPFFARFGFAVAGERTASGARKVCMVRE